MTNKQFVKTRRSLRLSQGQIARRAGVSQSLVSEFEIGYRTLSAQKIAQLEAALRAEIAQAAKDAEQVLGQCKTA